MVFTKAIYSVIDLVLNKALYNILAFVFKPFYPSFQNHLCTIWNMLLRSVSCKFAFKNTPVQWSALQESALADMTVSEVFIICLTSASEKS